MQIPNQSSKYKFLNCIIPTATPQLDNHQFAYKNAEAQKML